MHTATQLSPTGADGAFGEARRPTACPAFRLPRVSELPLRLEPVAPDTFGGLVGTRRAVQSSTTHVRGAHS
jgi:hypothetical protein